MGARYRHTLRGLDEKPDKTRLSDVVLLRASLQKKSSILNDRVHTRIAQRVRVIDSGIKIGQREDFF